MHIDGREYDRLELAKHNASMDGAGGVRLVELVDGAERGIRVVEFRTAAGLAFEVLVDRAMDIGSASFRGREFAWRSATGFRHPGLHEYRDDDGVGWLRSFSGLTVTAGLDHTLFTTEASGSHHHYPHRETTWNGLHGRVANIPARLTGYGVDTSDESKAPVLWAEGVVTQAAIFGEYLQLTRRIECDLDGNEIRLSDTVVNLGFDKQPHMFLYHTNFGWPLLEEGTRFVAPITATPWQTDNAAAGAPNDVMVGPQPAFVEQVYEHELAMGDDGETGVVIVNDRVGWAVEMRWDTAGFPHMFEWMHLREGAYALGVEPSTNHVDGRLPAEERDELIWLSHGEERQYRTRWILHDGVEEIDAAVARCSA